jgi:hypothetical protein
MEPMAFDPVGDSARHLQLALRDLFLVHPMTICARPGCTAEGKPKYCTRRCSAIDIAQRRESSYYRAIAKRGMNTKRQRGHKVLRPSDVLLMAAGRYAEAARMLYDRGFQAGWQTGRKNQRQLPAREFAKAG